MNSRNLITWVSAVGIVGVIFGVFYAFFGLNGLPVYQKFVPVSVYTPWSNGLYGAIFIGFCVLFFFAGRHALHKKDAALMKAMLYAIAAWLVVEASFSVYYGVYVNAGVDVLLTFVLGLPFVLSLRSK